MTSSPAPAPSYTCLRSTEPIAIDGDVSCGPWRHAPWVDGFVDLVTGAPAWFATRSALLWDDRYLYVGFQLEEPNVEATMTERDAPLYLENDVELFVAGPNAYYELEINALATVYEVLWVWDDALAPGGVHAGDPELDVTGRRTRKLAGIGGHVHPRGERVGFLDWDAPGLVHAVQVDGTPNDPATVDRGWSVEIALPWTSLALLAEGRPLPPRPGDRWQIECSRFQTRTREGARLPESAGWTWAPHGHYDSHIPELFPVVEFSETPVIVR